MADRPAAPPSLPAPEQRGAAPADDNLSAPATIRVGKIAGAHGLHGAIRMRPDNPDSNTLAHVAQIIVEQGGEQRVFALSGVSRIGGGIQRITLKGIDDATAADALRGAIVMVAAADLPQAGPREFYYHEAIGCEVVTTDGRRIGTIADIFSTGANDVLVVRDGDREILVPAIEDVVKSMDLRVRRVVIEAVPGLLD